MRGSKIEWTDMVWNPTSGCSKVSAGCQNCYAERFARRLAGRCGYPANNPFQVTLHPKRLEEPLHWRKPKRVFVNSMGDLFHEAVDEKFIAKVFAIMDLARQHIYCILTKRPGRAFQLLTDEDFQFHVGWFQSQVVREFGLPKPEQVGPWPLRNVWLGVSVENQEAADERIPLLLQTPAAVRFVSVEPMLGPVVLRRIPGFYFPGCTTHDALNGRLIHHDDGDKATPDEKLDWVIVGGETGPNARPMHPDWVRSLRDQAVTAGIPFFFKSWGEWVPYRDNGPLPPECSYVSYDGQIRPGDAEDLDTDACMGRVGKKRAGRLLDGRTWDEYPMEGGPLL